VAKKKNTMEEGAKKIKPWVKTILVTILSIAGIISAIVVAYLYVTTLLKGYSLGAEDKYLFFRDILIINLAIITVIFGAIAVWIHVYITERVKNAVTKPLEERDDSFSHYVQGMTLLNVGYSFWVTYDKTKEENFLDAAIDQTERAYTHVGKLIDENSDYILIKCQTRNNLGYYLAERRYYKDKEFAIGCAKYIKERIDDYPDYRASWIGTHDFIMSKKWEITINQKVQDQGH
jgi:hypothetical protein